MKPGWMVAGLLLACALFASDAMAALRLPALFADGAVVQRERPIRVWGDASPGAAVDIEFDGAHARAIADDSGHWQADLPAHGAGGPYVLAIRSGDEQQRVEDILVGDVWLASGQSNMEWTVAQSLHAEAAMAGTSPSVRHFKVPHAWSAQAQRRLAGGAWVRASPATVGDFSAVAYHFARDIHARTGVPIGIIDSSWGGSRIEAWMDAHGNGLDAATTEAELLQWLQAQDAQAASTRARIATNWGTSPADDAAWSQPHFDDRLWDRIPAPGAWEEHGYPGMDGVAWYRKRFRVSGAQAAHGITLSLARIDDTDQTFVNGHVVGGVQGEWDTRRVYPVPASALRAGWNVVAVRVTDTGGGGGFHGDASEMYVDALGQRQDLAGSWRFRPAAARMDNGVAELAKLKPTMLYNGMIHPLQPYRLRGVLWYQGESNSGVADAWRYRRQFAAMLQGWRAQWGEANLPFLWVQLANFRGGRDEDWALLRESQSSALRLPATAQAVAIDIGDPDDIHPRDKREVARRLALAARKMVYGEQLVSSGPVFRSVRFEGGQARVEFDLQGSRLALRAGMTAIPGFEVAAADGVFHPATASIHGDQVWVGSDAVTMPVAVRYAWRNDPGPLALVNAEGLPAAPFRSASQ